MQTYEELLEENRTLKAQVAERLPVWPTSRRGSG